MSPHKTRGRARRCSACLSHRKLWALGLVLAAIASALPSSTVDASASPASAFANGIHVEKIDRATCAEMLAQIQAGRNLLAPEQQAILDGTTDRDCKIVDTDATKPLAGAGDPARRPSGIQPMFVACQTYDKSKAIYIGPLNVATRRIVADMCYNGDVAWKNGYMQCYFSSIPVYGTGIDYCDVRSNNSWEAKPRIEGHIFTWAMPWWNLHYPWMYFIVWGNGHSSPVTGELDP